MKRVLVTGGSGYLGGRLVEYLSEVEEGEVIPALRFKGGGGDQGVGARYINLSSEASLAEACIGVDIVIHLAALNSQQSAEDPLKAYEVNTRGTQKLLEASVKSGVSKFIYFSTAHVYSPKPTGVLDEASAARNEHPYALTHYQAEREVLRRTEAGEINGVILRLSNSIGRPVSPSANCWSLVVNDICRAIATNRKIHLHSNGLQSRDFISISSVCKAVSYFISQNSSELTGSVFNLGSGRMRTILDMSKLVASRCKVVLGFEPEIQVRKEDDSSYDLYTFPIDRLLSTGFEMTEEVDLIREIDDLLLFCHEQFRAENEY